jgi:hypothetical protein
MERIDPRSPKKNAVRLAVLALFGAVIFGYLLMPRVAHVQRVESEPIAYIGHGAMFDQSGSEVAPTLTFIREAQTWYEEFLLEKLSEQQRREYKALRSRISSGLALDEQSELVLNTHLLDWLLVRSRVEKKARIAGKNNLIKSLLTRKLTNNPDIAAPRSTERFVADRKLMDRLKSVLKVRQPSPGVARVFEITTPPASARFVDAIWKETARGPSESLFTPAQPSDSSAALDPNDPALRLTTNGGAAYRTECLNAGVPIPPDFGPSSAWVSQGLIPQNELFIVAGLQAEVLTFNSTTPGSEGMCIALPRFDTSDTVILDGVICLGRTGMACFWDNEKNGSAFTFTRGSTVPFSNFGGGSELIGDVNLGGGGVCSDCHAGENPYIIHGSVLEGLSGSLPTFAPSRFHEPIVRSGDTVTWPDNLPPMNSPSSCSTCHGSASTVRFAGRLPHISEATVGYCGTTLRAVLGARFPRLVGSPNALATMPMGSPGSQVCTPNLPTSDPQFLACNPSLHTQDCNPPTPTPLPTTDQRFIKCSPQVKSLLDWCGQPPGGNASGRGDPHMTTVNGVSYDFQGAGEFVHLTDASGLEIQVRQTPVSSAGGIPPDAHTGLASCVSVITAVGVRINGRRVTLQPSFDRERKTLVLRVDGKERTLGQRGVNLGGGVRVVSAGAGTGAIEILDPNGTKILITTNWWASQSIWYMNVDVTGTQAREGILGTITPGNWLPMLPDGTPMGPRPVSLTQRYTALNRTFADAWRVTNATSLFTYAPGTSTATFTDRSWPPNRPPCVAPGSTAPPAQPIPLERATGVCSKLRDPRMRKQCAFDVSVTGETSFAQIYLKTQALLP